MNLASMYPLVRSMLLLARIWYAEYDVYCAVEQDRVADVATYLNLTKADINKTDKYGKTLLTTASWYSSNEVIELLLKKGADINKADNNGDGPLHYACEERDFRGFGETEITNRKKIAQEKQAQTAILLLNNGAQIDMPDKHGCIPLHLATRGGHKDLTKLLIQKETNINLADKEGRTALHCALDLGGNGEEDVVRVLVENGADVNKASYDGETPLTSFHGLGWGTNAIAKFLLEHGASIDVSYRRNRTIREELMSSPHYAHDKNIFLAIVAKKKEKDLLEKKLRLEKEMKENAIKSEIIKLRNSKRIVIDRNDDKVTDIYYQCSNQKNILLKPIFSARSSGLVKFLNNE